MTNPDFSDAPKVDPIPTQEDSRDAQIADLKRQLADAQRQNAPQTPTAPEEDSEPEFYVHLADGSVERVKESELPAYGGTNAANGHFEKDGSSYVVTGVFPVETKVGK